MNSFAPVDGWCSGGVCNREHIAGDSGCVGFYDVRSHYLTTKEERKLMWSDDHKSIFACWKESGRLIRLSAYTTVAHLAVNVVVLASLLAVVTSVKPCPNGRLECPRVVAGKSVWVAFSALILTIQPCESPMRPS